MVNQGKRRILDLYKRTVAFLGIGSLLTLLYALTTEVILLWSALFFGVLTIASLWIYLYQVAESLDKLEAGST